MNQAVHEFAGFARLFSEWAEGEPQAPVEEVRVALCHLNALYRAALFLPDAFGPEDGEQVSTESKRQMFRRFGVLPFNYYSNCFDPLVVPGEEPVVADVADDLSDIWRDLKDGLWLYDAGHENAACWQWRQSFYSHWGHHAVGAMYALHCWMAGNQDVVPSNPPLHPTLRAGERQR